MNKDWETIFRSWTKPPSDSEDQRCENAENMVRKAIEADGILSRKGVRVFTQGSYRHNTNVRLNSDVDVNVCLIDCIFYRLPALQSPSDYGIGPCTYPYPEFKNQVEIALVNKFGRKSVTRGNKAFDIHANGYRVDADVVACFEYRLYTGQTDYYGNHIYLSGTEFQADDGVQIVNWPEQNATNGTEKNKATGNRYKFSVRVLKRLRDEMQSKGIKDAENVASFLIESLLWNVPNAGFGDDYVSTIRYILAYTFKATLTDQACQEWGEVNELKYLFRQRQPWTRQQAHNFLWAAWDYIGFK